MTINKETYSRRELLTATGVAAFGGATVGILAGVSEKDNNNSESNNGSLLLSVVNEDMDSPYFHLTLELANTSNKTLHYAIVNAQIDSENGVMVDNQTYQVSDLEAGEAIDVSFTLVADSTSDMIYDYWATDETWS